MRFVPVRSESEQAVQQWHRARQRVVRSRTRLVNQLRAFLYEYGQVLLHICPYMPDSIFSMSVRG